MTIQIMRIFKESFKHVRTHMLEWVRIACAPLVVFFFGLFLVMLFYFAAGFDLQGVIIGDSKMVTMGGMAGFLVGIGNIIYFVTHLIASYCLYINGFRYGVLNEGGNRWWTLHLNMRLVKMLLYTLLLGLLVALYVLIAIGIIAGVGFLFNSTALDVILGIFIGLYGFYLLIRIGLLFLLISIDQRKPLRTSWHLLKGNVLRFLGLMLLIGISILAILAIGMGVLSLLWTLSAMVSSILALIVGLFLVLFGVIMWLINWAVYSKASALVYKALT